jgi:hypothetical protein
VLICDEVTNIIIKDKKIIGYIIIVKEQLMKFNLGNGEEPIDVLISAILFTAFQIQIKEPLLNYKDVLAWDYKGLKDIPKEDKKIVG